MAEEEELELPPLPPELDELGFAAEEEEPEARGSFAEEDEAARGSLAELEDAARGSEGMVLKGSRYGGGFYATLQARLRWWARLEW